MAPTMSPSVRQWMPSTPARSDDDRNAAMSHGLSTAIVYWHAAGLGSKEEELTAQIAARPNADAITDRRERDLELDWQAHLANALRLLHEGQLDADVGQTCERLDVLTFESPGTQVQPGGTRQTLLMDVLEARRFHDAICRSNSSVRTHRTPLATSANARSSNGPRKRKAAEAGSSGVTYQVVWFALLSIRSSGGRFLMFLVSVRPLLLAEHRAVVTP